MQRFACFPAPDHGAYRPGAAIVHDHWNQMRGLGVVAWLDTTQVDLPLGDTKQVRQHPDGFKIMK